MRQAHRATYRLFQAKRSSGFGDVFCCMHFNSVRILPDDREYGVRPPHPLRPLGSDPVTTPQDGKGRKSL